jgi:hypothetical protein
MYFACPWRLAPAHMNAFCGGAFVLMLQCRRSAEMHSQGTSMHLQV